MNNQLLSISQASHILELSTERVRQLAASGELPSLETPLGRLFARTDVERLAERRRRATGAGQLR